ncbi:MAG: hypothetical protein K9I69_03230 [Ignavibacteriales bacterium]|nr:hypothetical protein [Ignavibacteriales bacterium]
MKADFDRSKLDSLLLIKKSEEVSLAILLIDDISGSYTVDPRSRSTEFLVKFMKTMNGRKLLGFAMISDASDKPTVRLSLLGNEDLEKKPNMWIESEVKNYFTHLKLVDTLDHLNNLAIKTFNKDVLAKYNKIAGRSDVCMALQRGQLFLNEFPMASKWMIICSDFKDTYGRQMILDSEINLLIVGHARQKDVIAASGREIYSKFESYDEAINRIINKSR